MRAASCLAQKYPPAPQGFPAGAEVFICRDCADSYNYCGAWGIKGKPRFNKFIIPGSVRRDGLFSDPLEARDALNKYLEGLEK